MNKTMKLKNIWAKTEPWLREIGVQGYEDLNQMGALEAYRRLKSRYPSQVNLVALYALEAALWGLHWLELPPVIREELKQKAERLNVSAPPEEV